MLELMGQPPFFIAMFPPNVESFNITNHAICPTKSAIAANELTSLSQQFTNCIRLHAPQDRQSSGVSREQAISSRLVASSALPAKPSTVSSATFCSTVNCIASAAAFVRR